MKTSRVRLLALAMLLATSMGACVCVVPFDGTAGLVAPCRGAPQFQGHAIGTVIPVTDLAEQPLGWLRCEGQAVDAEAYPELAQALGSVGGKCLLPDYRRMVQVDLGGDVFANTVALDVELIGEYSKAGYRVRKLVWLVKAVVSE